MDMPEEFISELIIPLEGTFEPNAMLRHEPSLPGRFRWRDREYSIAQILNTWKEDGPCQSGSTEKYLRKHWYHIKTTDGTEMKIYFQRQARTKATSHKRWWLYTISRI